MPAMIDLFLQEDTEDPNSALGGQVTEHQLDDLGIPRLEDNDDRRHMDKDQRAQSYQRAVMLTNNASRARRQEYLRKRDAPKLKKSAAVKRTGDLGNTVPVTATKPVKRSYKKLNKKIEISPPASPQKKQRL